MMRSTLPPYFWRLSTPSISSSRVGISISDQVFISKRMSMSGLSPPPIVKILVPSILKTCPRIRWKILAAMWWTLPPFHFLILSFESISKFSWVPSTKQILYFFLLSFLSILISSLEPFHIKPKSPHTIRVSPLPNFFSLGSSKREAMPWVSPVT